MTMARIETFICDVGWRAWDFVKVETDDGLVGRGERSDGRMPGALVGAVKDFEGALLGQDPRQVERLYWSMYRISHQHLDGSAHRAMTGVELALPDLAKLTSSCSASMCMYATFALCRPRVQLHWHAAYTTVPG